MKTKITLLIAIVLVTFSTNAQTKVGTVNSELIISKMPQLKLTQERLKKYGEKLDSINNIKVQEYDTKVKAFNDTSKSLSEEDKKTKYGEISQLNQELLKFRKNGTQMMQLRRNELMRPLYKKISEIIQQVAKEKGYSQILTSTGNEFAYIDEKYDITKLVLTKMGLKD